MGRRYTLKEIIELASNDLNSFNKLFKELSNFSRLLSTEYIKLSNGYAEAIARYNEALARIGGVLHGGAIMGLLDEVSGVTAASVNPGVDQVTMELKINFLRPLTKSNSPYKLVGEVIRRGRTTIVVEGRIYDSEGKVSAVSLGTWYILYDRVEG